MNLLLIIGILMIGKGIYHLGRAHGMKMILKRIENER